MRIQEGGVITREAHGKPKHISDGKRRHGYMFDFLTGIYMIERSRVSGKEYTLFGH